MKRLGWNPPTEQHYARLKYRSAAPMSVLDGIIPDQTSDNYRLCILLDQGNLGSCTGQACAQMIRAAQVKRWEVDAPPVSALALYYWGRYRDGTQMDDVGSNICTVLDMAAGLGVPLERDWPYQIEKFDLRPSLSTDRGAYDQRAVEHMTYEQMSANSETFLDQLERALTVGYLVAFGVQVSERFCSEQPSGIVEAPLPGEKIAGGHALTAIGHNHAERWALVLNSWGPWGDPELPTGCFRMSYDYMTRSADRWFVPRVPRPEVKP